MKSNKQVQGKVVQNIDSDNIFKAIELSHNRNRNASEFKKMHRCFGNWHRFLFRFHFTGKYLLNDQDKKKEFAKSLFYMYLKFPLKVLLKIILRQLSEYIFIIILLDRKELNEIVILNNSQRIKRGYVLECLHYSKSEKIN